MNQLPDIPLPILKPLADALGEADTGTVISRTFHELGIEDRSGQSTKWKRLHHTFVESQRSTRSSNQIYAFIKAFMAPVRFVEEYKREQYNAALAELNTVLSFIGIEFSSDGEFRQVKQSKTLGDAERRYKTIREKFNGRRLHPEVSKYCKAELMQENYYHALFEACKGLAQRVREASGADGDGADLVDLVFSIKQPLLAFNTLQTESEQSAHKGFAQLLKGCFAALRNPIAHEPKINWRDEEDAADYFSLISLLHRRLDKCVPTAPNRN
jgi:uncharacterized protein (TIGR02391 family)